MLSCKSSTSSDTAVTSCYLTQEIEIVTDASGVHPDTATFMWNSSNVLVKITEGTEYDTLVYVNGKLSTRTEYEIGGTTAGKMFTYTWSCNNLTTVVETGTISSTPYTTTTNITWNGTAVTAVTQTTNKSGSTNLAISNIVMSGGNFVSADVDLAGAGAATTTHVTAICDTKKNVARFVIPTSFVLPYFSANNIVSITATTPVAAMGIVAGDKLLDNTFTYTADGEVATEVEAMTKVSPKSSVDAFTYLCK